MFVLAGFTLIILSGCTIEKRRYTSGFHIEGRGHNKGTAMNSEKQVSSETGNSIVLEEVTDTTDGQHADESILETNVIPQSEDPKSKTRSNHDVVISAGRKDVKLIHVLTGDILIQKISRAESDANQPTKGRSNVHPDAFSSLICGIAAMGCLAGIFLTGATPIALFIAFLIAMVILAFFATRLAKRAFKDMHYARDRFGGKAMAALGMLLGVLSIVAFLGLITIVVLGIAFVNLT